MHFFLRYAVAPIALVDVSPFGTSAATLLNGSPNLAAQSVLLSCLRADAKPASAGQYRGKGGFETNTPAVALTTWDGSKAND
jgi:hypothetical protein